MSYFSEVTLRPDSSHGDRMQVLPFDAYGDHQFIWKLFPQQQDEKAARNFLFRRWEETNQPCCWYLVSAEQPKAFGNAVQVRSRAYEPSLKTGDRLHFSLKAAPLVSRIDPERPKQRGRKNDIFMDAKWQYRKQHEGRNPVGSEWIELQNTVGHQWLEKQGVRLGFRPLQVLVEGRQHHELQSNGRNINFDSAQFKGVLEVTDPSTFVGEALRKGVGSRKGFGCGLLLIRRI